MELLKNKLSKQTSIIVTDLWGIKIVFTWKIIIGNGLGAGKYIWPRKHLWREVMIFEVG